MNEQSDDSQVWLSSLLRAEGAVAGTVHRVSPEDPQVLELRAAVNIPPPVQAVTARVPRGKGMAGLAYERARPVSTCDLKTDDSGDVRPGAKAVDAQAAVALPIVRQGAVVGVVGLAWMDGRDISESEMSRLTEAAASVPLA